MSLRLFGAGLLTTLLLAGTGASQPKADDSLRSFASGLRPLLLDALPPVLYEKSTNWGHQELAPNGIRLRGLRPEVVQVLKNDGKWRKIRVTTQDLPRTLTMDVTDFKTVDAERQTFKVLVAFQAGVEYEKQNWSLGVRVWSGSIRARVQVKLALECENVIRLEATKGLLPNITLRLHVTKAEVGYDQLVVEHINGVGGSAAKLTGETLHKALKRWKPSVERDLLARAEAAIVKAADTREVRIGLGAVAPQK